MKKKSLSVAIIALSLSLTGCISPSESQNAGVSPAYEQEGTDTTHSQPQDEENVEREESGYIVALKTKELPITDEESLVADSTLILNSDATFTITESGITPKSAEGKKAARGEVLHAIQYETNGYAGSAYINVSVDGEVVEILFGVPTAGYLVISAPSDADISLGFPYIDDESVEQVIDAKSGERLSKGIAEAFYLPVTGSIENGVKVTQKVTESRTATFEATVEGVTRTPFSDELGWADEGKMAWLIVEAPMPTLDVPEANVYDHECAITAFDDNGIGYSAEEMGDAYSIGFDYADALHFLVPAQTSNYTLEMTCSAGDVEENGDDIGKISPMTVDATVIMK